MSLSMLICLSFTACAREIESIPLWKWIQELDEEAGITEYQQEKPYYMNVPLDSELYPFVQAAVEWKVLEPSYAFDPQQQLNKEWAAYTLMNLIGRTADETLKINDISSSSFQKQIQAAAAIGLMPLDQRGMFHPKKILPKEDAEKLLQQAIAYINHKNCDHQDPQMILKKGGSLVEAVPITYDERTLEGTFPSSAALKKGDAVHWKNSSGMEKVYVVKEIEADQNHQTVQFSEFQPEDQIDSLQLSGSQAVDFSKAEIVPGNNGMINQLSRLDNAQKYLTEMSVHPLKNSFDLFGFQVTVECSGSSLRAKVSRTMKYGTEISASAMLNHVNVNYAWNSQEHNLKNAYFRIDFDSEEDLSVQNSRTKNLYGDFSKIDPQNFLSSLRDLYQDKNDAQETTLTLCRIVLPIPNAPVFNITTNLELHLSTSGKAELTLNQENGIGFETRDGVMRLIKEKTGKADASLKATTKMLAAIRFALCMFNGTLMDTGIRAGAQGTVQTTAHLYDAAGNMEDEKTDLPGDVCENSASGNPDVLICTDIDSHWVMNILVNSQQSLAGKLGISKEFDLFDGENAPLIPGMNHHFEDGKAVDQCTRKAKKYLPTAEGILTAKRICLAKYSYVVDADSIQEIEIEALPQGYTRNDLVYASSDPAKVSIDAGGCMHGISEGSAVITIQTRDQKHIIHCNVIVPAVS